MQDDFLSHCLIWIIQIDFPPQVTGQFQYTVKGSSSGYSFLDGNNISSFVFY